MRLSALLFMMVTAATANAKVNVVATTGDLAALVREVGGEAVQVTLLARPTQDPHFVDPRPSLVLSVARAQLLVLNGMELEIGWLPTLITSSRNAAIQPGQPGHLDCSTLITPREIPAGRIDRSMGDIHPGGNPHYTKDPSNTVAIAAGLAKRLGELDAENVEAYQRRAEAFTRLAHEKMARWRALLEPFRGTPVVPYHKSWIYFLEFAGLVEVAYVEPKPGLPPTAAHVAAVLKVLRARHVPLILQEDWYPSSTSELLARNSGATLVRVPGMSREDKGYLETMDVIVKQVVDALNQSRRAVP
jgi:zinc/manganese transport system substrate-binding protein